MAIWPALLSTERELVEGDVLWTDVSITYQGYCSDFGRTWIVGRDPSPRQRRSSTNGSRSLVLSWMSPRRRHRRGRGPGSDQGERR